MIPEHLATPSTHAINQMLSHLNESSAKGHHPPALPVFEKPAKDKGVDRGMMEKQLSMLKSKRRAPAESVALRPTLPVLPADLVSIEILKYIYDQF